MPVMRVELDAMPSALRLLAEELQAPDDVPAMCLRDGAVMIESLRMAVADAVRRPMGVVPDSAAWLTPEEMDEAELRRSKKVAGDNLPQTDLTPSALPCYVKVRNSPVSETRELYGSELTCLYGDFNSDGNLVGVEILKS